LLAFPEARETTAWAGTDEAGSSRKDDDWRERLCMINDAAFGTRKHIRNQGQKLQAHIREKRNPYGKAASIGSSTFPEWLSSLSHVKYLSRHAARLLVVDMIGSAPAWESAS
jgi:hypothetical protein